MSQSWVQAANSQGESMMMPEGYYKAKVVKAIRYKRDGSEFRTDKGPFVMLVYENEVGEQATQSLWLTPKAMPFTARAMQHLGFDLERMDQAGVTIDRFEDEEFSQKQFVGRESWVRVEHRNDRANADAVNEDDVPTSVLAGRQANHAPTHQTLEPDDIPF